ncbi:gamma-glutamyl hydrolase B-like [Anoplophora glabripennis]|uniref:gamma-glutamyl hydrolase B-like n=1 Tax=Anoplophora glabripennis TaxID=217634 RepID=UPI000875952D|nr:gamma-glutamyl hydrolase B-like [Anoplophora glabripennis]
MFKIVVILLSYASVNYGIDTPIIGILSEETYIVQHLFPEHYDSYITASYVKYIESAGGRVVPVWIGQSEEYYRRVINYTNGILFPGGGTYFNETKGYGKAAKQIYQIALEANKKGIYYPIWGCCLGMQVLPFAQLGVDIRVDCLLKNTSVPLNFKKTSSKSRLFSNAPKNILELLSSQNLTFNEHRYCLTQTVLKKNGILNDWQILATNEDVNKLKFISAMESVNYPIYGVQFHPEKNPFEFEKKGVPHSKEAVDVSLYFASFFVEESKKNNNTFPSEELEKKSLIYNYNPRYTGISVKSPYEQVYIFNRTDFSAAQLL